MEVEEDEGDFDESDCGVVESDADVHVLVRGSVPRYCNLGKEKGINAPAKGTKQIPHSAFC